MQLHKIKDHKFLVGSIIVPVSVAIVGWLYLGSSTSITNAPQNTGVITQGQTGNNTIINHELIFQSDKLTEDTWTEMELKNAPPGAAEYALLRFTCNQGVIIGKARIKGSPYTSMFFTDVDVPVAIRNVFEPTHGSYKIPTILEFAIVQRPLPDAKLQIYTRGWVEPQWRIPHP
jgi:hypothetical protein